MRHFDALIHVNDKLLGSERPVDLVQLLRRLANSLPIRLFMDHRIPIPVQFDKLTLFGLPINQFRLGGIQHLAKPGNHLTLIVS